MCFAILVVSYTSTCWHGELQYGYRPICTCTTAARAAKCFHRADIIRSLLHVALLLETFRELLQPRAVFFFIYFNLPGARPVHLGFRVARLTSMWPLPTISTGAVEGHPPCRRIEWVKRTSVTQDSSWINGRNWYWLCNCCCPCCYFHSSAATDGDQKGSIYTPATTHWTIQVTTVSSIITSTVSTRGRKIEDKTTNTIALISYTLTDNYKTMFKS